MPSEMMNRVPAPKRDKCDSTILHATAELPSGREWLKPVVRNECWDAIPASAAEVRGADAGRYNAGAVLPQGASDVQSIRASQTADPRAKQTPSGPTRRSARVNSKPGDGGSPGSMTARRFHLGEVVESSLRQPFWLPFLGLWLRYRVRRCRWLELAVDRRRHLAQGLRVLKVGHIIARGGQDNIENRQLLCTHCNRVKGDQPQAYLVTGLRELGIAA